MKHCYKIILKLLPITKYNYYMFHMRGTDGSQKNMFFLRYLVNLGQKSCITNLHGIILCTKS
jgi:hypothetical protein